MISLKQWVQGGTARWYCFGPLHSQALSYLLPSFRASAFVNVPGLNYFALNPDFSLILPVAYILSEPAPSFYFSVTPL